MTEVKFYHQTSIDDKLLTFAVIVSRYHGKWIFCKNVELDALEIPGGYRKHGETIDQTASRKFAEKTGCSERQLTSVGIFHIKTENSIYYGKLYFAEIASLGKLSLSPEFKQIQLFETIPTSLAYPKIQGQLFHIVQGWLNMQTSTNELWDIYDENRNFTGRTHRRGDFLADGDHHLVVHVWMLNSKGEFLITKRSPNKGFPNMWETTGGSAIAGDDSITAAIREVSEETGLKLHSECGKLIYSYKGNNYFTDVWLFRQDFDLTDVVLLEGETCDVKYAHYNELLKLRDSGMLIKYRYLDELLNII